jgi:hypothetical protein
MDRLASTGTLVVPMGSACRLFLLAIELAMLEDAEREAESLLFELPRLRLDSIPVRPWGRFCRYEVVRMIIACKAWDQRQGLDPDSRKFGAFPDPTFSRRSSGKHYVVTLADQTTQRSTVPGCGRNTAKGLHDR